MTTPKVTPRTPAVEPAGPRGTPTRRRVYFVHLGAFKQPANARRAHATLTTELARVLRPQAPGLALLPSTRFWRVVVARAFARPAPAAALCRAIRARGPDCYVQPAVAKPARAPHRRQVHAPPPRLRTAFVP